MDQIKDSHKENSRVIGQFQSLINTHRAFVDSFKKQTSLWGDLKVNYKVWGKSYGTFIEGIEEFETEKVKEMEEQIDNFKKSVNSTISVSFKDFKENIEQFMSDVDWELKLLVTCEKEVDKRYRNFEQVIEEAEISISKELPFGKDFWLYEHNFIISAE